MEINKNINIFDENVISDPLLKKSIKKHQININKKRMDFLDQDQYWIPRVDVPCATTIKHERRSYIKVCTS